MVVWPSAFNALFFSREKESTRKREDVSLRLSSGSEAG